MKKVIIDTLKARGFKKYGQSWILKKGAFEHECYLYEESNGTLCFEYHSCESLVFSVKVDPLSEWAFKEFFSTIFKQM